MALSVAVRTKLMGYTTHLVRSNRGNDVPTLRLEIRYYGDHNIRIRTVDEDGHYSAENTIGSNDPIEVIEHLTRIVRFGGTKARKLRTEAEKRGVT